MKLHELSPVPGSTKEPKRKGRGKGTGNGKTAGRGHKGQGQRAGGTRPGFEGGQLPLMRRLPKRGFFNIFSKHYTIFNVSDLDVFDNGAVITEEDILMRGMTKDRQDGIKILGNGDITKKVTVKVTAFSKSAIEKIEAAGGKAEVV